MTAILHAEEIDSKDLDESLLAQPSAEPLSGDIAVRSRIVYTSDDQRIVSGTWESEPGLARWEFLTRGEMIHVLHGKMIITKDGEEPLEITAGTTAVFPIGWTGTWEVIEKLRKVFVVYLP